jgi:hypothetical protein
MSGMRFQQYFFFRICEELKRSLYFRSVSLSIAGGKEMMDQSFPRDDDKEIAEKCRKALEKSFGIDIPLPKCMVKKENKNKS